MASLIICIILLLIAVGIFVINPRIQKRREYGRELEYRHLRWTGIIPLGLALLILVFSCITTVSARNVGVVTTAGKPVGTEDAGWVIKAPWQDVTEINGAVVTNEYQGDNCIRAKIGDGSSTCVDTTIRWRINPDKADTIYGDYRSENSDDPTEGFRKAVISTQFKAAIQTVLGKFNPVANLEVVEGGDAQATQLEFVPNVDQMGADLEKSMTDRLGKDDLAEVVSITVSGVALSDSTQRTINEFIAEVGKTRTAAQAQKTAEKQAATNETISKSVSNNPAVLQSRCIDALLTAIEKKYELPAGFNCLGDGSAVVVPGQK